MIVILWLLKQNITEEVCLYIEYLHLILVLWGIQMECNTETTHKGIVKFCYFLLSTCMLEKTVGNSHGRI